MTKGKRDAVVVTLEAKGQWFWRLNLPTPDGRERYTAGQTSYPTQGDAIDAAIKAGNALGFAVVDRAALARVFALNG